MPLSFWNVLAHFPGQGSPACQSVFFVGFRKATRTTRPLVRSKTASTGKSSGTSGPRCSHRSLKRLHGSAHPCCCFFLFDYCGLPVGTATHSCCISASKGDLTTELENFARSVPDSLLLAHKQSRAGKSIEIQATKDFPGTPTYISAYNQINSKDSKRSTSNSNNKRGTGSA